MRPAGGRLDLDLGLASLHLSKVVGGLQAQPDLRRTPPNALASRTAISGEIPDFAIHDVGEIGASHAENAGRLGHAETERLQIFNPDVPAGVRRVFIRMGVATSVIVDKSTSNALPSSKRKMTRQLAVTVTDQNLLSFPVRRCNLRPGALMSPI
jgi:hypothetical protein